MMLTLILGVVVATRIYEIRKCLRPPITSAVFAYVSWSAVEIAEHFGAGHCDSFPNVCRAPACDVVPDTAASSVILHLAA